MYFGVNNVAVQMIAILATMVAVVAGIVSLQSLSSKEGSYLCFHPKNRMDVVVWLKLARHCREGD
jgi:hypothetical protein